MLKNKNRIIVISIAIFLMLSMAASMLLIPTSSAHTPPLQIPTFAYVQAEPNPVGVGQPAIIYMWVNQIPDGAELGNNIRFQNYQLIITEPNGQQQTENFPVISDPTSNQGYTFTPDQTGTYILNFTFPGYKYTYTGLAPSLFGPPAPSQYVNDTYLPSSASATLTVQQTAIPTTPTAPLPTSYWTRPIYGENSNWYTISSNWLGSTSGSNQGYGSDFPGDAVGPQTSHIMWNAPLQMGGVVGGNAFAIQGDTYFEGSAYNNRYTNPIIIDGNLYYTEPISFAGVTSGPTVCVDLRTGQQIWSSNIPALSFGYIYDVQDPNQHGVYPPMLVSSTGGGLFSVGPATWRFYDAYTGDSLFNVTNVPQGTSALGVNGEYLLLMLTNYGTSSKPNYYLQEWNSSRLWDGLYSGASTSPSVVPPILDGSNPSLLDFNISIPSLSTASSILDAFTNNMVICMSGSYPGGPSLFGPGSSAPYTYFAVNLNATKGTVGSLLWSQPYNAPAGNITVEWGGADPTANSGQGVFVEQYKETSQFVGYSMATGKLLWGPTSGQAALDYYNFGYNAGGNEEGTALAYGKLYSGGYSGIVYCYDLTSGNLLWTYGNGGEGNSTSSGTPYPGNYPTSIYAIGSGIVYTTTTAHTVETPLYQGALTRAINATTGAEVFTLSAFTGESGPPGTGAIADGFATFFNGYDNSVYVVGKGPSATIVQAPQTAITAGENVVIQGTVMDTSAGTHQSAPAADFPNGVPVCSDASMAQWMGYVYQQQQAPTNFTGVTVTLTAIDPNNNYITLGTATTDATGHFIYSWQAPQVSGKYTITATFTGTNGYWGSSEETGMTVQNAPTTQAPTSTPTSDLATMSALTIGIAAAVIVIIIAIAIVGLLLLRKKP